MTAIVSGCIGVVIGVLLVLAYMQARSNYINQTLDHEIESLTKRNDAAKELLRTKRKELEMMEALAKAIQLAKSTIEELDSGDRSTGGMVALLAASIADLKERDIIEFRDKEVERGFSEWTSIARGNRSVGTRTNHSQESV